MTPWEALWFFGWVIIGSVLANAFIIWRSNRQRRR